MNHNDSQLFSALKRLYGGAFLRYIFAIEDSEDLSSIVSKDPTLANDLLSLSLESIKSGDSSTDMSYAVTGRLTSYGTHSVEDAVNILDPWGINKKYPLWVPRQVPVYAGSLINFTRLRLGGSIFSPARYSEDPITKSIQEILVDVWPSYLLRTQSGMMPLSMIMRTHHGIEFHPSFKNLSEQILADSLFKNIFKRVPTKSSVYSIMSNPIASSNGNITSIHLTEFVNSILFHTLVSLGGDNIAPGKLFDGVKQSVDNMRNLMKGEIINVPSLIHFSHLSLSKGSEHRFGAGILRNANEFEERVLLEKSGGTVLQTSSPIQVIKFFDREPTESDIDDTWEAAVKLRTDNFRIIEDRATKLLLSVLLTANDTSLRSSTISSYYTADILNVNTPHIINTSKIEDIHYGSAKVDDHHIERAIRMYDRIEQHHSSKLDIAITRLVQASVPSRKPSDSFIDAAIAWESLLNTDISTTERLVASTAMLLQRHHTTDTEDFGKELSNLYKNRSGLVHGSKSFTIEELEAMRDSTLVICCQILDELYTNRTDLINMTAKKRLMSILGLTNRTAKSRSC